MTLQLEINAKQVRDPGAIPGGLVMVTPPVGAPDYWLMRVRLSPRQAIVAFPKFMTVGIGFQNEEADWNTNLPYAVPAWRIFEHIKANKGDDAIKDEDCIAAITLIRDELIRQRPGDAKIVAKFEERARGEAAAVALANMLQAIWRKLA